MWNYPEKLTCHLHEAALRALRRTLADRRQLPQTRPLLLPPARPPARAAALPSFSSAWPWGGGPRPPTGRALTSALGGSSRPPGRARGGEAVVSPCRLGLSLARPPPTPPLLVHAPQRRPPDPPCPTPSSVGAAGGKRPRAQRARCPEAGRDQYYLFAVLTY